MSSTYSTDLRIELIGNGEQSGVWGTTTNNNLGTLIEQAIAGLANVSVTSGNQALTAYNGVSDEARCAAVRLTTTTVAPFNIYVPPVPKLYVFVNDSAYAATVYASTVLGNTTAAGSGISLAANSTSFVRCDGTNMYDAINHISGTLFVEDALTLGDSASVANNLTVTGSAALGVSQTATITLANPAVITVANAPQNDTTVSFTTSGSLPANITAGTLYYVVSRTSTTFRVATSAGGTPISTLSGSQSGIHTVSTVPTAATAATGSNSTQLATTGFVTSAISAIPTAVAYQTLAAVVAATTANITLSGTQTIDGISLAVGDRVLVKNQTSTGLNGVYVVASSSWTRASDANTAAKLAAAQVPVLKGSTNGGFTYATPFKSTDTLGSTTMPWYYILTTNRPQINSPTIQSPTISNAVMSTMSSSVLTLGTAISVSGTSAEFTDLPSWVKRVTLTLLNISTSGTSLLQFQLGTSGGYVTSGYNGTVTGFSASSLATTALSAGFVVSNNNLAAANWNGSIRFDLLDTGIWVGNGSFGRASTAYAGITAGGVVITDALTKVRLTTVNGTDTFDSGVINIIYE